MLPKRLAICLLTVLLCICACGCSQKKKPQSNIPDTPLNQVLIPEFTKAPVTPVAYTPVYASAFGDTIILATVPVEGWDGMESACPPREISNGGRVKCDTGHEDEVPITKVIILEDLIPRVCSGWFRDMIHLERIQGLEKLHTHEVKDMSYMFAGCESLTKLDVSAWDVSNVIDMTDMFKDCHALEKLPDWYE